ncbi:hypothetical protein RI054_09g48320 [Pseudoscourfieldia marina]
MDDRSTTIGRAEQSRAEQSRAEQSEMKAIVSNFPGSIKGLLHQPISPSAHQFSMLQYSPKSQAAGHWRERSPSRGRQTPGTLQRAQAKAKAKKAKAKAKAKKAKAKKNSKKKAKKNSKKNNSSSKAS